MPDQIEFEIQQTIEIDQVKNLPTKSEMARGPIFKIKFGPTKRLTRTQLIGRGAKLGSFKS